MSTNRFLPKVFKSPVKVWGSVKFPEDVAWSSHTEYKNLSDDSFDESRPCLSDDGLPVRRPRSTWEKVLGVLPWLLTILFASISIIQYTRLAYIYSTGSTRTGWATDFEPVRSQMDIEIVTFTSSPSMYDNGTIFVPHPDPIEYNGYGHDIDLAWERLIGGRYIRITEEEAFEAFGESYVEYWDEQRKGFVIGFDMFHTLHCLNEIRKLTPEKLQLTETDSHARIHHFHCLSQIRQFIICSGDMTPIPTVYYPASDHNYVDSDVPHTCRNFGRLRDWLWERFNGSLSVPPSEKPSSLDFDILVKCEGTSFNIQMEIGGQMCDSKKLVD
ncbi:hypothetical protein GQ53DRAFT_823846 [Thozetella sp. PMI_491]|nr:hypothetical protein GQ53DRAFT_823846 [Thozetella sp. PMI_491]